jgi:Xaa-Pro dipeptidase
MAEGVMALPFEAAEYERRMNRLTEAMATRGLDGMVTFVQENQYWLCGYETTGFHSFPQALIVTAGGSKLLVTRQLEIENATENAFALPAVGYQDDEDPGVAMVRGLAEMGLSTGKVGLEKKTPWVTIQVYEALLDSAPDAEFADCSGMIELLRSVKSESEIAYMRQAARCVGAAMRAGVDAVYAGATEFEVAAAISHARIAAGSHFTRNPTYVASGARSALGHASWIGREIEKGDVVFFELGANVRHYDSALIRCAVAGPATDAMKACHEASVAALESVLAVLKPGAIAKDVNAAAITAFDRRGFAGQFDHRVGYGIGIEFLTWIERGGLSLDSGSTQVVQPGMTVHLIPFFKTAGMYSIGVSETVLITETGNEVLETGCPRELFER